MQLFNDLEELELSPAGELEDIILNGTDIERGKDTCPVCKEKLGMITLLGFCE
jgi:uncharacterized protein (UPF0212 family)